MRKGRTLNAPGENRIPPDKPRNRKSTESAHPNPHDTRRRIKCPIHFIWSARIAPSASWRCVFPPQTGAGTAEEGTEGKAHPEGVAIRIAVVDRCRGFSSLGETRSVSRIVFRGIYTRLFSRRYFRSEHHASESTFKLDYAVKDFHVTLARLSSRIRRNASLVPRFSNKQKRLQLNQLNCQLKSISLYKYDNYIRLQIKFENSIFKKWHKMSYIIRK